jgi:biotin transport system substrate-specific component
MKRALALSCLFAALLCAGAYISIPLPLIPVPLTLSNLFAVLAGLLLGPLWGGGAVLLYLGIGALGFPVFSGGRGSIAHFAGPSGGYLVGYLAAALLAGLVARRSGGKRSGWRTAIGSSLGFAAILCLGAAGLKLLGGLGWDKAAAVGILPFLPGDALKAVLAALAAAKLGPFVDSLLEKGGHRAQR